MEGETSSWHLTWLDVAISCILLVVAVAYFSLTFTRTLDLRDEGYLLFVGARAAAGEVPHRDFIEVYGPGAAALNGLILWLFDRNILPLRIVLAITKAGAVVLTFLISRLLVPRTCAVFGAVMAMAYWGRWSWNLNTPYAALYTIPLCMLAVFVLIQALLRGSAHRYFAAGLIAGTAVLFKQSLAIFNAYGMLLAVCAVGVLDSEPTKRPSWSSSLALASWTLAASAVLIPFSSEISLRDYLLHFLPFHLLMGLVAAAVLVRGGFGSLWLIFKNRLCPLAVGLAVMPVVTACVYGYWGSLDKLIFNMFVFPATLVNYSIRVPVPPLSLSLLMIAAIALISSGLLTVRGRRALAVVLGAMAVGLAGIALYVVPVGTLETVYLDARGEGYVPGPPAYDPEALWEAWGFLNGVQAAAISAIALVLFAPSFFRREEPGDARRLRVLIPLVLFQTMMTFQVFPRAAFNCWLIQGALMPLFTIVLFRWYRLGAPVGALLRQRASAAAVTALLPLWMIGPVALDVVLPGDAFTPRRPLDLPAMEGITLSEREVKWYHADELEKLVAFLREEDPRDSPVFVLTNESMILFLSQRKTLFPDRELYLFVLKWGLLPEAQRQGLDVDEMIRRLENTPDALLIFRLDRWSVRLLEGLPGLHELITRKYEIVRRINGYSILRQKGG